MFLDERSLPNDPGEGSGLYGKIKGDILTCRLAPNSSIYEQELATEYGVSKSPIREALLRLVQEELVEVRARSGYRVRPISIIEANETYDMRLIYEEAVAELIVRNASDDTIEDLYRFVPVPVDCDLDAWLKYNRLFHIALGNACGNGRLARTISHFIWQFDRFTYLSAATLRAPIRVGSFVEEHRRIVDALGDRNVRRAQGLIRRHVEGSRKRTLSALLERPVVIP